MKRFIAVTFVVSGILAASWSLLANPHQSDRIRAEARLFSQIVPLDPADAGGVGPGQQNKRQVFCGPFGDGGRGTFDKDISCDDETVSPDNELAIAVHPTNPNLLLAGSNDYQITFLGNTSNLQVPSGFFFSADGGGTWIDGELPLKGSLGGGDPAPGFDVKHNQMVFVSLSFVCGQLAPVCSRGNIMFASSPLGPAATAPRAQITWSDQVVANGSASDNGAQQLFLDKEWIAVDNHPSSPHYGNIYITYQQFRIEKGAFDESPVMFVKSEDGGVRWTLPVEISGRNPVYCTFQDDADDTADPNGPSSAQGTAEGPDDPLACDQNSFSYPVVAPDGTLYIQWDNEQNSAAYEPPQRYDSQVLLIRSMDGGDSFVGERPTLANQAGCVRVAAQARGTAMDGFANPCIVPIHVVNKEDSYDFLNHGAGGTPVPDYPINVSGRTTLTGHQFRVNSAGTIAVGPNAASPVGYRLWTVFADNFNGVRPGNGLPPSQPAPPAPAVTPITNTDVFYAYSDDGGSTWVGGDAGGVSGGRLMANPVDAFADQWFPWADTNKSTGALVVGYMDANVDGPLRDAYGFTNVTVPIGGAPGAPLVVSSQNSHPNNSLFFRAGVAGCVNCATFIGDYNGLAVDANGEVHSVWTDMRRDAPAPFPTRKVQDAFYARQPHPPVP
jgi:hypothetical protein